MVLEFFIGEKPLGVTMLQSKKAGKDFRKQKTENPGPGKHLGEDAIRTGMPINRMLHYEDLNARLSEINLYIRTGKCPECGKMPISCTHRAAGNMFCRACGNRWEV